MREEAAFRLVLLVVRDALPAELLVVFSAAMDLMTEALEGSRFGGRGYPDRRDDFFDCAYPTFEQMARHWYNSFGTNPSAGTFAHRRFT